jgi:biofilm PGA synthesis protein PgaD
MKRSLIIEKPELQSNVHRYGWSSVTFIFWVLYIYLWLPFITLIAWWIGVKLFHLQIVELHGYSGVIGKLGLYSAIVLVLSVILIGWAKLERFRFKDSVRRTDNAVVSVEEIAKLFKLQESQLIQLRQKQSVIVSFSDKGQLSEIAEYKHL